MFVQLNVLCLANWLHAPLRKKYGEVLVFSIFHPTRLFRPTQLLIWMNFPPYTIIPHCTAIRHFTVYFCVAPSYVVMHSYFNGSFVLADKKITKWMAFGSSIVINDSKIFLARNLFGWISSFNRWTICWRRPRDLQVLRIFTLWQRR